MTANRARAALSACFAWAVREGLADSNPVIGTNRWDEQSRDRVLSADELAVVWHAAGDDAYGTIIKLLILLGQRLNEIGGLRWSEIIDGTIQLPSERTKNGRAHGVPLSALAQGLLDSRPRVGDFVFGQHRPFTRWAKSKLELDERIEKMGGKLAHWTHHDLRRSCASGMGEIGIAPFVVETVLNHVSGHRGGIAGVYNKSDYRREKKHALELWASHVEEVVAGGGRHKVVQLRA
jgi:integrase